MFLQVINKPEESIKEASEGERNDDEESESDEQNEDEEKQKYRTSATSKNQPSSGEIICGSVIIDDNSNSSNNNTIIKQSISMINDEMNNLLKQSKLYVAVIELLSKHYNKQFKDSSWQIKEIKQNINTTSDNVEIMNMFKLIKTSVDLDSIQLSELRNTLIWFLNWKFKYIIYTLCID